MLVFSCLVSEKAGENISMKPLKNVNRCLCSLCSSQFCRTNMNCTTYLMEYWQEFQWANLGGILILFHRIPYTSNHFICNGELQIIYMIVCLLLLQARSADPICIATLNPGRKKIFTEAKTLNPVFSLNFHRTSTPTTMSYQTFSLPPVQCLWNVTKTQGKK